MKYNFKSMTVIPKANELIDVVLTRTQRKTPTVIHPGYCFFFLYILDMKYLVFETFISEK